MSSFFTQLFDNSKPQPESQTQLDIADLTAQRAKLDAMIENLNASPPLNQSTRLGPLYVPGYAPNPVSSVGQPSWNALPPPPSGVRRLRAPQDQAAAQVMSLSSSDPAAAQVWNMSSDSQLGKFGSSFGGAYSKGGKSYRRKARKAAKKSRKARKAAKKSKRSSRR
jgi:hypothetical protein